MAKDYLTVQASSVPAERAFSSGTDLVTSDRCSLAGKTIEMTQFFEVQYVFVIKMNEFNTYYDYRD